MRLEWALYAINRSHWKPSTKSRIEPDCYLDFQSQSLKASSLRLLCKANSKLKKQAFFGFWNEKVRPNSCIFITQKPMDYLFVAAVSTDVNPYHHFEIVIVSLRRNFITNPTISFFSYFILCLKGSLWNTFSKLPRFWF